MPEKSANTAAPVTNDHPRPAHLPKNIVRPKGVEKDPLEASNRGSRRTGGHAGLEDSSI